MTADGGVTRTLQRRQATEDQVRVAYGAVPTVLEGLSIDHPVRAALRDRARVSLIEGGYLTAAELGTLPLKDALAAARRRLRDELIHPMPVRGAPRSGESLASKSPPPAAIPRDESTTGV